jgi:hypothetical protein
VAERPLRVHATAAAEFEESAAWYEARRAGLGAEVVEAVSGRIADVIARPHRWRGVGGTRRAPLARFPYTIVFREASDGVIEIVAVAHASRRPEFWRKR